ncbi:MAG: DUF4823 domain-containing protein [Kiloniellaceae bacterium]
MLARFLVFMVLILSVAACAPKGENYQTTDLTGAGPGALSRDARMLVAVEGDGKYVDKSYPGSGWMTRDAMIAALSAYTPTVAKVPGPATVNRAKASALKQNMDFLIYLKILHWEERTTEWSGKPDRIKIDIRLIDGKTGDAIESRIIEASTTHSTWLGDHPQDLLIKPFEDYAAGLFGSPT